MWLTAESLWEPGPWQDEDKEVFLLCHFSMLQEQEACQSGYLSIFYLFQTVDSKCTGCSIPMMGNKILRMGKEMSTEAPYTKPNCASVV
jgi:hypothetical protein